MAVTADKHAAAAPERLRQNIDSGRTGDKVPVADPAAAPLGTDDEAGGSQMTAQAAALVENAAGRKPEPPREGSAHVWYIGAIIAAALLIVVFFAAR
jgi:hypothetical protein